MDEFTNLTAFTSAAALRQNTMGNKVKASEKIIEAMLLEAARSGDDCLIINLCELPCYASGTPSAVTSTYKARIVSDLMESGYIVRTYALEPSRIFVSWEE